MNNNIDKNTVDGFGDEWNKFAQNNNYDELKKVYDIYFKIFPAHALNRESRGFDAGCGSGRWAKFIAPKVKSIDCIDPSKKAIDIAKKNLSTFDNIKFHNKSIDSFFTNKDLKEYDFGYSLGVLHHIPNIYLALKNINYNLKKGSPFLLYLYYNFENRNFIFRSIWQLSNLLRIVISRQPFFIRSFMCDFLATFIYYPFAKINKLLDLYKFKSRLPLDFYKDKSFYMMRTDSLDRFGTKLEHRFSKKRIIQILNKSNFEKVSFLDSQPFWTIICYKRND